MPSRKAQARVIHRVEMYHPRTRTSDPVKILKLRKIYRFLGYGCESLSRYQKPLFSVPRAFVPHFCAARCASRVGEPRYERVLEAPHQEQSGTARSDARPSQCKAPGHDSLLASSPPPRSPFSTLRKGSLHRLRYAKPARRTGVVVVVFVARGSLSENPRRAMPCLAGPPTGMGSFSSETSST